MLNLALAFILNILTYSCIWMYGRIGGQAGNLQEAFLSVFGIKEMALIILSNIFFGGAVFLYFKQTSQAIPISIAIGVLTAFFLGVIFVEDVSLDWIKFLGVCVIILGIYLLFK